MGTVMESFGTQLREERERRKVGLDEIARLTKIRVRYLQALEEGQHERLPGIVFAKGYVRAFAETIGADADRLVEAYVDEQRSLGRLKTEASQENVLEALAAAVDRDHEDAVGRSRAVLIVALVVLVGGAVFWFGIRPRLGSEPMTAQSTPTDSEPVQAAAVPVDVEPRPVQDEPTPGPIAPAPIESAPVAEPVAPPIVNTTPAPREVPAEETVMVTPPPATESAPTAAAAIAVSPLTVTEYGVGTDVKQRVLVGESTSFAAGTRVVFWNRVLGGDSGRQVRHVWMHEGAAVGNVELSIGAAHWRTYSRQTLRSPGNWTVEARDEDDLVLASVSFVATPPL